MDHPNVWPLKKAETTSYSGPSLSSYSGPSTYVSLSSYSGPSLSDGPPLLYFPRPKKFGGLLNHTSTKTRKYRVASLLEDIGNGLDPEIPKEFHFWGFPGNICWLSPPRCGLRLPFTAQFISPQELKKLEDGKLLPPNLRLYIVLPIPTVTFTHCLLCNTKTCLISCRCKDIPVVGDPNPLPANQKAAEELVKRYQHLNPIFVPVTQIDHHLNQLHEEAKPLIKKIREQFIPVAMKLHEEGCKEDKSTEHMHEDPKGGKLLGPLRMSMDNTIHLQDLPEDEETLQFRLDEALWEIESQPDTHSTKRAQLNTIMERTAYDFRQHVLLWAKVIIKQHCSLVKVIPPMPEIGGIVGGEKYPIDDTLFKFPFCEFWDPNHQQELKSSQDAQPLSGLLPPAADADGGGMDQSGIPAFIPGKELMGVCNYKTSEGLKPVASAPTKKNKPDIEGGMKVGGHELMAINYLYNLRIPGMHYPKIIVIDYLGFRCVAMRKYSRKIVGNLIYGSNNAGSTGRVIHCVGDHENHPLPEKMKTIAESLHLQKHSVTSSIQLYTPIDLEVHEFTLKNKKGEEIRNFFVIDPARLFPPETRRDEPPRYEQSQSSSTPPEYYRHRWLYELLRPELLHRFFLQTGKKLSSDAHSSFQWLERPGIDPAGDDVDEATDFLYHTVIPDFASQLKTDPIPGSKPEYFLIERLHRFGINCRHLGHVLKEVCEQFPDGNDEKMDQWKEAIVIEMVSRLLKCVARGVMQAAATGKGAKHSLVVKALVPYFNAVFGEETLEKKSLKTGARWAIPTSKELEQEFLEWQTTPEGYFSWELFFLNHMPKKFFPRREILDASSSKNPSIWPRWISEKYGPRPTSIFLPVLEKVTRWLGIKFSTDFVETLKILQGTGWPSRAPFSIPPLYIVDRPMEFVETVKWTTTDAASKPNNLRKEGMGEVGRADDALKAILILRKEIEKLRETLPTNWMEQVEKKNKEIKEKQADHATHKKSATEKLRKAARKYHACLRFDPLCQHVLFHIAECYSYLLYVLSDEELRVHAKNYVEWAYYYYQLAIQQSKDTVVFFSYCLFLETILPYRAGIADPKKIRETKHGMELLEEVHESYLCALTSGRTAGLAYPHNVINGHYHVICAYTQFMHTYFS